MIWRQKGVPVRQHRHVLSLRKAHQKGEGDRGPEVAKSRWPRQCSGNVILTLSVWQKGCLQGIFKVCPSTYFSCMCDKIRTNLLFYWCFDVIYVLIHQSWHGSIKNIWVVTSYSSEETESVSQSNTWMVLLKSTILFCWVRIQNRFLLTIIAILTIIFITDDIRRLSQDERWSLPQKRSQFKLKARDY